MTISRTTSVQSLDIHAIAIGPNMLPSAIVHAIVGVSPYPFISITSNKAAVSEDSPNNTAVFTVASSSAAPAAGITVSLEAGGGYDASHVTAPAASGATFAATIPSGATTTTLAIAGVHNSDNASQTVILTILDDPGSPTTYTVGAPKTASVAVQDDGMYTVTYNANGGSGAVPTDSTFYLPGAPVRVLGNTGGLVKTGCALVGWNTQANGSGTTYTQDQTFQMSTVSVTLYAVWASVYLVTYNANGGSGNVPIDANVYLAGATVNVLGSTGGLAKTGYAFVAWNTQANGSGTSFTPNQTFTMGSANDALYAMWAPSISTVAGNGIAGYSGDNGPATSAELSFPWGIAFDASGNFYFADNSGQRIRKVSTDGTITTVAGNGIAGYSGDNGAATSAQISGPTGVAVDASGNLYIADTYNAKVRKVTTSGIITTIAGPWLEPLGVAVDSAGNLYVSDYFTQVWKVSTSGAVTTVAGNGTQGYSGDGGPATSAALNGPWGVAVDSSGNLYIADQNNYRIRKVSTSGIITTVAGNGNGGYSGDGGPATSAMVYNPQGVAVDAAGNLYICDVSNLRIRKVSTSGTITTVAGNGSGGYSGDGGAATSSSLSGPRGAAFDAAGNLFIADSGNNRIRKVTAP